MKEMNYSNLNKLFTRNSLKYLIENGTSQIYEECIAEFIEHPTDSKNSELITELYGTMRKNYRNEYYYKNTLINKLLLGKHSINTTSAISELPVSKSKADFILINGIAEVFEIKTELDNLERLPSQIEDYYKIFSYVSVLTSEKNYYKVFQLFKGSDVGIKVLTKRNTISTKKKPIFNNTFLNPTTMFKVLRKKEFESVILKKVGHLPEVNQFEYYKECQKLFLNIPISELQFEVNQALKKRNSVNKDLFESIVPKELRSLAYFSDYSIKELEEMNMFLQKKWR